MSRSSWRRERAQTEPTVALAAVLALSLGVAAYVPLLTGSSVTVDDRELAEPTLSRVHDALTVGGVADPGRLEDAVHPPDGFRANASLSVAGRRWTTGDAVPTESAAVRDRDRAVRLVGVALAPGRVRPGKLVVRVWR